LIVTAANATADLKERLKAVCREEGAPFGLIVERLDTSPAAGGGGFGRGFGRRGGGFGGFGPPAADRSDLPNAIAFRKLFPDGHEEVVRGGRFVGVTSRALRNVAAAGADRNAASRRLGGMGTSAVTVVAPSVIVTQLDVRPEEGTAEKPPLLARPALE